MEKEPKTIEEDILIIRKQYKDKVHEVLAHSYSLYFALFLLGIFLDLVYPIRIFRYFFSVYFGVLSIILGSLLIYWAQKTSRNLKKEEITKDIFNKGPYRFSRSPTHWGLFFLIAGFGIMMNAFFIILLAFIAFLVSKLIFLKEEEVILVKKYGEPYLQYKKSVRF
jgi:protein-S-isoprenylcysteine O-methyltransferase Ste14